MSLQEQSRERNIADLEVASEDKVGPEFSENIYPYDNVPRETPRQDSLDETAPIPPTYPPTRRGIESKFYPLGKVRVLNPAIADLVDNRR